MTPQTKFRPIASASAPGTLSAGIEGRHVTAPLLIHNAGTNVEREALPTAHRYLARAQICPANPAATSTNDCVPNVAITAASFTNGPKQLTVPALTSVDATNQQQRRKTHGEHTCSARKSLLRRD